MFCFLGEAWDQWDERFLEGGRGNSSSKSSPLLISPICLKKLTLWSGHLLTGEWVRVKGACIESQAYAHPNLPFLKLSVISGPWVRSLLLYKMSLIKSPFRLGGHLRCLSECLALCMDWFEFPYLLIHLGCPHLGVSLVALYLAELIFRDSERWGENKSKRMPWISSHIIRWAPKRPLWSESLSSTPCHPKPTPSWLTLSRSYTTSVPEDPPQGTHWKDQLSSFKNKTQKPSIFPLSGEKVLFLQPGFQWVSLSCYQQPILSASPSRPSSQTGGSSSDMAFLAAHFCPFSSLCLQYLPHRLHLLLSHTSFVTCLILSLSFFLPLMYLLHL